jgi:hypothetical protein
MTSDKWVKVHTVENIFEMDTLKGALEKEEIEYVVREHKDTAYDGLFILQKGYASFFVRAEDETAVKTIVAGIRASLHVVHPED